MKVTQNIALDKNKQQQFTKETKELKKKIKVKKTVKELKKERKSEIHRKRGLVYIAHLPHGFYEEEIKNYFKQFGDVTNVKVCRSSKTGKSKGFGYIEFLHSEVAKIAAETMNNYIMFKKRLVAEYVPAERRPKLIFHGKKTATTPNWYPRLRKRYRVNASRNKEIDDTTHLEQSKQRIHKLQSKLKRLKDLGIDYSIKPVDVPNELRGK